ncbi:MAG: YdcF family protein [Alphaproteobacteria bacterium]
MKQFISHFCMYAVLLSLLVWLLGFCIFTLYAISFKLTPDTPTQAIVVLTGGTDRIETAVELLKKRTADYLLISGVNKKVSGPDLLRTVPTDLTEKITLGYWAENTRENALETTVWIKDKNITSILLVTSFYHMPRSIFELKKSAPFLKIIPYPVFPKSFGESVDWIKTRYAWLLFLEYHKFLAVHFKSMTVERLL